MGSVFGVYAVRLKCNLSGLTILLLLTTVLAEAVQGTNIEFIQTGTGSGSIGGNVFSNSDFVITAKANTNELKPLPSGIFTVPNDFAQITISGLGSYLFLIDTRTFVNQTNQAAGFSRGGDSGFDLFNTRFVPAFSNYDLTTSIGPIQGSGEIALWDSPAVVTSGGTIILREDLTLVSTFEARLIPEPSSLSSLIILLIFVGMRRQSPYQ